MRLRFLAVFLTMLGGPLAALDLGNMTDPEREAFRAEVQAYLLENPEVLQEAFGILRERQQLAQALADLEFARTNREALFNDGHSFVGGNPEGDITIVEFMDYRCGFCKRAFPEVKTLLQEDQNIRYIVKELPVLGEQSVLASRFAIATQLVAGDAAYQDVHDALMEYRGDISSQSLSRLGDALALDTAAILAQIDSDEVTDVIAKNRTLAGAMEITGTPTFVFEDQMVRGYVELAQMQQLVEELRAE